MSKINRAHWLWRGTCWLRWGVGFVLMSACSTSHSAPVTPAATVTIIPPTATPVPLVAGYPDRRGTATSFPVEREITFDQPVEAIYIPGEVRELYLFFSDQPRRVGITLEPLDGLGDLRLAILVYSADQQSLARRTGPENDPLLLDLWDIPAPGWYTVQVYGPENQARAFRLELLRSAAPQIGGGMIGYGETRSGEIAVAGQRDEWLFQGKSGERVLIMMAAVSADAYLMLYAPNGDLIAHNDDGPQGGFDPVVELVLPADGRYRIVARLYEDDQTGAYRLSLEQIE